MHLNHEYFWYAYKLNKYIYKIYMHLLLRLLSRIRQNKAEYYSWQNTAEYGKIWQRYKYKKRTASIYSNYKPDNCCN